MECSIDSSIDMGVKPLKGRERLSAIGRVMTNRLQDQIDIRGNRNICGLILISQELEILPKVVHTVAELIDYCQKKG